MLSFAATIADYALIRDIVERAVSEKLIRRKAVQDLNMDLTACHCSGTPLRLADLLKAPAVDFAHDIRGIQRHIDRDTGELCDCFMPRSHA